METGDRQARQDYGISRWGEGYFGINSRGHAVVRPSGPSGVELDLHELALDLVAAGLRLPVLVRFDDILRHRLSCLSAAFESVARETGYTGGYRAIYPVKVNQQRSVVDALVAGGGGRFGLEAGSKPELMAVLAASAPGAAIVCNGYKDAGYVRLALIGRRLGFRVCIVIEKPDELPMICQAAAALGIEPELGVRVRLSATASGNWQNSGGTKSKFGLSASQLLRLVDDLQAQGRLAWLTLLHSHIGSQIPDLGDIRAGMRELARYYVALCRRGVPLRTLDVGGGLGVDYEGSATTHYCSMNYGLEDYARAIMSPLAALCPEHGLAMPEIFTESGRAMTAHHAMLLTEVIAREDPAGHAGPPAATPATGPVGEMARLLEASRPGDALSAFRRVEGLLREAQAGFADGELDLAERAAAEQIYFAMARTARAGLRPEADEHRALLERLDGLLAERVFCNFSIFQSMPDVWAIDQVFPVMPLQRLDEDPERAAVLHDLTCDSDGCIDAYVAQGAVESTLPLHAGRPGEQYLLGIFLVGAYQEILGDMHNLFGDTDAVNVRLNPAGDGYLLAGPESGDTVADVLRYVHFEPERMLERYREILVAAGLGEAAAGACFAELEAGLYGYTYLE